MEVCSLGEEHCVSLWRDRLLLFSRVHWKNQEAGSLAKREASMPIESSGDYFFSLDNPCDLMIIILFLISIFLYRLIFSKLPTRVNVIILYIVIALLDKNVLTENFRFLSFLT